MDLQKTFLTFLTPVIATGSAWLCAVVAKHGVSLDPSGVNALAVAGATAGGGAMLKLIHDLEKRKQAQGVLGVARSVDAAVVAADPNAGGQLEDAVAAVQRAAEARFAELEAKIPAPIAPAPVAPAPVAPVPDPVPPAA